MVYYLGRDVIVGLSTENDSYGITAAADTVTVVAGAGTTAIDKSALGGTDITGSSTINDLTGVDIGIGAMDEDITYFGIRSVTKAEIKKETTVSITRKKNDTVWDTVYNDARFGVSGAATVWPGLEEPTATHGYRVYIALKSGSEVISVPNACVQSHTVTVNADGVSEETIEFMSYVTPHISTVCVTTSTTAF